MWGGGGPRDSIFEQSVQLVEAARTGEAIKGNGKTTKETPTTITITTTITTTTTATETTTITNNKTGGRKLPRPILLPQLRPGVMLEICQSATVATLTTMDNALQSAKSAKELDISRTSVQREGTSRMRELVQRAYVVVENPQKNPNVVTGTFLLNDHYDRIVIDCGEKIVHIPLPNGEILEVQGERPEKDPGSLACIKADEKKIDGIWVVRDFHEV
ncbi:hypothetical protein Tco_0305306, partial [Tanacetum coccineum]